MTRSITPHSANQTWRRYSPACLTDLVVKKFAITLITLLNFATLGTVFYYIYAYTPIPNQAFLVSPFIIGVLGALTYLKFPTCGISSGNYTQYTNPLSLIGRIMAYLFFGPLVYLTENKVDLIPYHDPIVADDISQTLEEAPFNELANRYKRRFTNLYRYGFINHNTKEKLKELYEAYKPLKAELDFQQKASYEPMKGPGRQEILEVIEAKIKKLNRKWERYKTRERLKFPHPKQPKRDFSKFTTRLEAKTRGYCCLGTPFDMFSDFKA